MSEYSMFFGDEGKLSTKYDNVPTSGVLDNVEKEDSFFNKENAKTFAQGTQAGGLGSGLMSVGIMSGSPLTAGGGLILSLAEAQKRSEQEDEANRVRAAEEMKKNQLAQINSAIAMARGLS